MKMPGPAPAPGSLPSSRVEKRELRAAGQWFSKQVPSGSIHLSPRASYKSKPLTPNPDLHRGSSKGGLSTCVLGEKSPWAWAEPTGTQGDRLGLGRPRG